jgi:hypothetical protein
MQTTVVEVVKVLETVFAQLLKLPLILPAGIELLLEIAQVIQELDLQMATLLLQQELEE